MKDAATSGSLHRQAKLGWLWGALEQFAQRGLAMLVSIVLARMLAPESFGLIASVSIFLTTAQQLIDGGISSRIVQKKEIHEEDYTAFFWCNAAVSVLACSVLVICSGVIARFYGDPQLRAVVAVMALSVLFMNAGRVQELQLVRTFRFKLLSLITISSVAAGSITGLTLAFAGAGVWAILGQQLVLSLIRASALWWTVPWKPAGKPAWPIVKDLYSFGLPIVISQTIRGCSEQLVNVLTARFVGIGPLGYYDRGRFLPSNVASLIQNIFFRTNLTVLAKLQSDPPEFRLAYLKLIRAISSMCMLSMTGLIVCAPDIITIILGEKWMPSLWFFRASCVMSAVYMLFLMNLDVLKSIGSVHCLFAQNIIFTALQAVGVGCGLLWSIKGMIIGSLLACAGSCWTLGSAISHRSVIRMKDQLMVLFAPAVGSVCMATILWLVRQSSSLLWSRFILCGIAGLIVLFLYWRVTNDRSECKHEN